MANTNNNNNDGAQEAPTWFDEWCGRTPAATRYIIYATLGTSLVGMITGAGILLANCPVSTVFGLQLWRLFTAPLMARSIIGCVIGTVIFASMAPKVERELGSLGFLLLCATFAWGTQVLYTTIIVFFMLVPVIQMPMLVLNCSSGLGSIWLGMLANTCASNPDQPRRVLFLPLQVPNKYYPFILIGLFSLLFGVQFDSFAALIVGYLYAWGYIDFVKPSPDRLRGLEAGTFSFMQQWMGYLRVDQAGAPVPTGGRDVEQGGASGDVFGRGRANPAAAAATARPAAPTSFPGSGHTIGGASSSGGGYGGGGGSGGGKSSGGKSAGGKTATAPDRTEILAALERRLGTAAAAPAAAPASAHAGSDPPAASAPPMNMDLKLLQMQELGFDRASALAALQQTHGDVDRAASLLS